MPHLAGLSASTICMQTFMTKPIVLFDQFWAKVLELLETQLGWQTAPRGSRKRCLHCFLGWLDVVATSFPTCSRDGAPTGKAIDIFIIVCILAGIAPAADFRPSIASDSEWSRVLGDLGRHTAIRPFEIPYIHGSEFTKHVCGSPLGIVGGSVFGTLNDMCVSSGLAPLQGSISIWRHVI